MSSAPIGVFDSGVGGLPVLREIRLQLPHESLCYVADSAYAPYGNKSEEEILARCDYIVRYFLSRSVKAIVVACNTATSVAVDHLRRWCPVPIVAMEPAIKPAALHTRSGVVGVLATRQTIGSANVNRLIAAHGQEIRVVLRACDGFVEQVERGDLTSPETRCLVEQHVAPLVAQGVDTLVLGCTHYPFLQPMIAQVVGTKVDIIDPSPAIARQLKRRLSDSHLLTTAQNGGSLCIMSTGDVEQASCIIQQMWGEPLSVYALSKNS